MPRWTAITRDDLKSAEHGSLIDRAGTLATGGEDPVAEAIAKVVARVRRAVRQGNRLDLDPAKIPDSLKESAVLLVVAALARRIGFPLDDDTKSAVRDAREELKGIAEKKLQVEPADDPDEAAGPVNPGTWNSENKVLGRTHPVPKPGVQRPGDGRYANDAAPEDDAE